MSDQPIQRVRLFVGTFLPSDMQSSLGELKQYEQRLAEHWRCKIRLVHGKKLHLTWIFLGDVATKEVPEIERLLAAIASRHRSTSLDYTGHEFWPSAKHAQTMVLIPQVVADPIRALAAELKEQLRPFTQKPVIKPYRPHITLARMAPSKSRKEIPDWLPLSQKLPLHHSINQLALIASEPARGDDGYQTLKSFSLI
jgi:2'-5' RNA ligase